MWMTSSLSRIICKSIHLMLVTFIVFLFREISATFSYMSQGMNYEFWILMDFNVLIIL